MCGPVGTCSKRGIGKGKLSLIKSTQSIEKDAEKWYFIGIGMYGWSNNMDKYEVLKLENQICFPLYVCSKEIVKKYTPYLDEIDLTYTQYITMMVLWEHEEMNVKELGKYLYLDSGTLTPVLKKLEQKGFVTRKRDMKDERVLNVAVTAEGMALREKALDVPMKIGGCVTLGQEDTIKLHEILHKLLKNFD